MTNRSSKKTVVLIVFLALLVTLMWGVGQIPYIIGRINHHFKPPAPPPPLPQPQPGDKYAALWPQILAHTVSPPRGEAKAPFSIVEFGDFQCPPCGRARPRLESLLSAYPHMVNLYFIHRPFPSVHKWALAAGAAGQAAADCGKFWPMYDMLYENQGNLEPGYYPQYAQQVGIDPKKFQAASSSPHAADTVAADSAFSDSIDVDTTPTLLVRDNRSGKVLVYTGDQGGTALLNTPPWLYPQTPAAAPAPAAS